MSAAADSPLDAIVIGGGFYGTSIATYLREERGFARVLILERERELLARASYNNQARIHNGYHYPRSFTTAYRSRINLPRFVRDIPSAVVSDFTKLYAIARRNSKVTGRQFERFCAEIGASLAPAPPALAKLFESRLVESVYAVEEFAFDATKLRERALRDLERLGVETRLGANVEAIDRDASGTCATVRFESEGTTHARSARYVFNCAYAGLNHVRGEGGRAKSGMKLEITEMALVRVPTELRDVGVTVMDGPFFSCMPFPPRSLHTLSHVRYTPHAHWIDDAGTAPYDRLAAWPRESRVDWMIRDASRFLPCLTRCEAKDSLFEVKAVLMNNEVDDGRPILFERSDVLPNVYFVLGGKIDNVYDVFERLDREALD